MNLSDYYSFLINLSITSLGIFVLGFIFRGRQKKLRYVFWIISSVFLVIMLSSFAKHLLGIKEDLRKLNGNYKIDITKSKYEKASLFNFVDLTMYVKNDNTFIINRTTPFFPSISGTWKYENDGDMAFTECSFDSTRKKFIIGEALSNWTFSGKALINGSFEDKIVFSKTSD